VDFLRITLIFFLLSLVLNDCKPKVSPAQENAELAVRNFLSKHGHYMALYFSKVDTAYRTLNEDSAYRLLLSQMSELKDLTARYSSVDSAKADSFYRLYLNRNKIKDSISSHYYPTPLGWFIIHYYQLEGKNWTDSFIIAFDYKKIIKVRERVEW